MPTAENPPDRPKWKLARITAKPGGPLEFTDEAEAADAAIPPGHDEAVHVGRVIKEYLKEARELLAGKHSDLRDYAPQHLSQHCDVLGFVRKR